MNILTPVKKIKNLAQQRKRIKREKNTLKCLGLDNKDKYFYPVETHISKRRYSVVSAVYGVETYIDDMMSSLLRQTLDFKTCIQVILVDDGSIDGSADICKEWARRFPDNVIYLRKENGGQCSARNYGMPYATGDWVTFIDPDDLVDKNYFFNVDAALDTEQDPDDLHLISCNLIFYHEKNNHTTNNHPLRYRYTKGLRKVIFDNYCDDMQLSASSAFFNNRNLKSSALQFSKIQPNGEDLHFIAKYLLRFKSPSVLFIPNSYYWYRKRADNSSTLDGSWTHPGRYSDVLQLCYLDLLSQFDNDNPAPRWLQRTITYDLVWYFREILGNHKKAERIPEKIRDDFLSLLIQILRKIDPEVIQTFELAGASLRIKLAMLKLRDSTTDLCSGTWQTAYDFIKNQVCIHYCYTAQNPDIKIMSGHKKLEPTAHKIRTHNFMGKTLVYEFIGWFEWPDNDQLTIITESSENHEVVKLLSKAEVTRKITPRVHPNNKSYLPAKIYRNLSQSSFYKERFRDAWLFMDRDTQADDNAEHLYRYIKNNHPEINAWFLLRESSHDWERLKKEGFQLLPFGSLAHKMALLNAKHLISSHADHYVTNYLPNKYYNDLMKWKYTFLQHGVIQNDLSGWLNNKNIHNFITATQPEYESLCKQTNSYKFTEKQVSLTGLPRHDRLFQNSKKQNPKNILIMPTWRQNIVGSSLGATSNRGKNPHFTETLFFKAWHDFLHSPKLKEMAEHYGYNITFFPHANLQPYIKEFQADHIKMLTHNNAESIQELFLNSSIMITDYSSVAFEMAYLQKPILYYQFDEDEFFGGAHTTEKGYFDYRRDGFGPVATQKEKLLQNLRKLLENDAKPDPIHLEQMTDTFPFRDGKCCERVFQSIIALG